MPIKRLVIDEVLVYDADLDGSLESLANSVAGWEADIVAAGGIKGSGYIDYEFYDHGKDINVKFRRPETDKEYDARLKQAAMIRENKQKAREKKNATERKTYARLKKKFEGNK